ncbi:hypothetical protein [Myroides odoratus]|uniref:Uncharacterized protein n=1 Tax=Myroides odoratus TaxID=256 RepID=A0A378RQB7_MYROD|nr:hypothetical protein [Myroides odoratus]QQU04228.1 hypothetical protein I6I89_02790 [Myroides odoratus]STZ28357.1 Uncharacterised protein [Myroides odoratus]
MKYSIILLSILLMNCGSRKVELQKRINDIETNLSVKIKELEIERSKIKIYETSRVFKADSIVEQNGKRTIYNPSSEEKEKGKEESVEKENKKEEDIQESTKDKSTTKDKITDRKQFNWWGIILPLIIVVFLIYIFRKPLKKLSRL